MNYVPQEKISGDPDGGGITNLNDSPIYITGSKTYFMDSNIYNEAFLNVKDCTIEKNCDDGRCLNNENAKGHEESNINIINSNHTYIKDDPSKVLYHDMDAPFNVEIKKGESIKISATLYACVNFYVYQWKIKDEYSKIRYRIYNVETNYFETIAVPTYFGGSGTTISTDNLNPGDYRLQITAPADDEKSQYTRTIDLTVLP